MGGGYRTASLNILGYFDILEDIPKKKTYVAVTIVGGNQIPKQRTPTNILGGTNPAGDFPMMFTFDEMAAQSNSLNVVMKIMAERTFCDRVVGVVDVPLMQIMGGDEELVQVTTRPVTRPASGKPIGKLTFSYKFSKSSGTAAASHNVGGMQQSAPVSNNGGFGGLLYFLASLISCGNAVVNAE